MARPEDPALARGRAERRTLQVRCPADSRLVGTCLIDDPAEVVRRAQALREAQPQWEALGPDGRRRWFDLLRDWLCDHADELSALLQAETGKARRDAEIEVPVLLDHLRWIGGNAGDWLAPQRRRPHGATVVGKELHLLYRPHPLVGIISPWNFPLGLAFMDAIPALAAGCAVLIKPSEETPLTVAEVVRGWREDLGAPPILDRVVGDAGTGEALVDAVDFVQFTGSTKTGRLVARRAAEQLKPYGMELGGKDPMIVMRDADLARAAAGAAFGGLMNSGQTCVSVERIYVEDAVYDDFLHLLEQEVAAVRQGAGDVRQRFDLGAMATAAQLRHVEEQVRDAVSRGAVVRCGGTCLDGEGDFFAPTILSEVDHSMPLMQEETFGPVLPVMRVSGLEEAITLANDSHYGLSASVWTRDLERGRAIASRLDCGAVNVNDVLANLQAASLPHGGWKTSGIGARMGGAAGVQKYCRQQAVVVARLPLRREPHWYPTTPWKGALIGALLRALGGRGRRRLPACRGAAPARTRRGRSHEHDGVARRALRRT
nr:aldehyde dehydrogenase family protein [Conexibacter sp. W3-3-2]